MEDIRGGQAIDMLRLELWIQTWNSTWLHIPRKRQSLEQENLPQTFPKHPRNVKKIKWDDFRTTNIL